MKNIKYTTDGKKVVVIGDLNQTEKIVQEIFVTNNGDEIPSGERFVVKSLLDEPSKSWKEKMLEQIEKDYTTKTCEWELKIKSLNKEKNREYKLIESEVKWLKNVAKQPIEKQIKDIINTLTIFISDKPKWVFRDGWDWNIQELNKELELNDDGNIRFRLLSLYGNSEGEITWRTNRWWNGDGSESDGMQFFDDYNKAILYAQNYLDSMEEYRDHDIKMAKTLGLKLDSEKLNIKKDKAIKYLKNSIDKYNEEILRCEKELSDLENN